MNDKIYYIYILTTRNNTALYVGMTNNLIKRIYEHKNHIVKGFTDKYNVDKLVWYEITMDVNSAITREKQIKRWKREWKVNLINTMNPDWDDLSDNL